MRNLVVSLAVALSFSAAACELALPFDRSLIPPDADTDATIDATLAGQDAGGPFEDGSFDQDAPAGDVGAPDAPGSDGDAGAAMDAAAEADVGDDGRANPHDATAPDGGDGRDGASVLDGRAE